MMADSQVTAFVNVNTTGVELDVVRLLGMFCSSGFWVCFMEEGRGCGVYNIQL